MRAAYTVVVLPCGAATDNCRTHTCSLSPLSRLQMALPSPSNIFAQECSLGAARACNTWFVSTTTRWFPWCLYRVWQVMQPFPDTVYFQKPIIGRPQAQAQLL
jgi:hypothetical protein